MWRRCLCSVLILAVLPTVADAQLLKRIKKGMKDFGPAPRVRVVLQHPPSAGLDVQRVAFGPEEGLCSGEFVDALISDFTQSGVEVVNRRQIEVLLEEHDFSLSGLVNRDDAIQLGEILGPTALVFVSVNRCATEQEMLSDKWTDKEGRTHYSYEARTTAYFRASLQIVDLATARIDRARTIDAKFEDSNKETDGRPAYPSKFDAADRAMGDAVTEVHRLFFPWTEVRQLKFFDNVDCSLRLAYNLVAAGNYEAAHEQSLANLEACRVYVDEKPKLAARALYNLGMTEFLLRNFDEAMEAFEGAMRIYDLDPTSQAMADCRRARDSAIALAEGWGDTNEVAFAEIPRDDTPPVRTADVAGGEGPGSSAPSPSAAADERSLEERLQELQALHEKGLISDELYEQKQAELLSDI